MRMYIAGKELDSMFFLHAPWLSLTVYYIQTMNWRWTAAQLKNIQEWNENNNLLKIDRLGDTIIKLLQILSFFCPLSCFTYLTISSMSICSNLFPEKGKKKRWEIVFGSLALLSHSIFTRKHWYNIIVNDVLKPNRVNQDMLISLPAAPEFSMEIPLHAHCNTV